jgi:hypothetical protein
MKVNLQLVCFARGKKENGVTQTLFCSLFDFKFIISDTINSEVEHMTRVQEVPSGIFGREVR